MNNRKRTAPAAAAAAGSSKKRKMDNVQKFYAVKAGFNPGVYLNYADCQKQTAGFKGAVCKYISSEPPAIRSIIVFFFSLQRKMLMSGPKYSQVIHVERGCSGFRCRQKGRVIRERTRQVLCCGCRLSHRHLYRLDGGIGGYQRSKGPQV
ncbi:hypothetical protein BGZ63DRAFT_55327 [Mariannaea sp. PMI_226]|nr:hypothetical protein BGZ63DRAFT_55327 [Mariannaea sp. PMI_226]